jgi:hypothetical protein
MSSIRRRMAGKSFSKNWRQRPEDTLYETRKLPPLQSQDNNKTFDYEDGNLIKII